MSEIKFTTHIYTLEHLLGVHYFLVPKKIVEKLGGKISIRLNCNVNNKLTFKCGLVALGEGNAYITLNNKRLKELDLRKGDEVKLTLSPDTSEFGMDMPDELLELLKQDKDGKLRFDKLNKGKQRYIIFYVAGVKNPQLRIDRALLLIGNLKKLPIGKESFRAMLGLE